MRARYARTAELSAVDTFAQRTRAVCEGGRYRESGRVKSEKVCAWVWVRVRACVWVWVWVWVWRGGGAVSLHRVVDSEPSCDDPAR
jgi:hypothetical protein